MDLNKEAPAPCTTAADIHPSPTGSSEDVCVCENATCLRSFFTSLLFSQVLCVSVALGADSLTGLMHVYLCLEAARILYSDHIKPCNVECIEVVAHPFVRN